MGGTLRIAALSFALAFALLLVVTGCGGGGGGSYTLAAVQKCLQDAGYKADKFPNPILQGSEGNLKVAFSYGAPRIDMAFGKDSKEAKALQAKAVVATRRFEPLLSEADIKSGVQLDGNVFWYSEDGPTSEVQRGIITPCLK